MAGRRPASDAGLGSAGGGEVTRDPWAGTGRAGEKQGEEGRAHLLLPASGLPVPCSSAARTHSRVLCVLWGRFENPAVNLSPGSERGEGLVGFCLHVSTWAVSGGSAEKATLSF